MPDRNDRDNQKNYLDDLKAGVKGPNTKPNPGRKA
jgi:hypothetical protein